MSLWEYANPAKFMALSARILPYLAIASSCLLLAGLFWGFFLTPADYKQGSTVKIIFLHVPTALMAINAWLMMLVTSLVWLIRRHHVSALVAKAAAPIGITMTLIAIATGAIWGKPMWGTYWAWDPRLTSFMILLVFYFGYLALWEAIEDKDTAADLTSILCIVGFNFCIVVTLRSKFLVTRFAPRCIVITRQRTACRQCFLFAIVSLHCRNDFIIFNISTNKNPY